MHAVEEKETGLIIPKTGRLVLAGTSEGGAFPARGFPEGA